MIIRRVPTDFRVEEVLSHELHDSIRPTPAARESHALYLLDKTSLTTPDAVHSLARALSIRPGKAAYAGLKDKHARTTQHVTVPIATRTPELVPRSIEERGWSARMLGWVDEPITAAAIQANRFTIVVRDMTETDVREMNRRAGIVCDGDSLAIINYFGDQRFGSARHGHGFAGRALIRGDFEAALKLLIATPARKDSGKRRGFTRAAASAWEGGDWKSLVAALPTCPERRAIEVLAAGRGFREAFAALPYFQQTMAIEAYQSFLWNQTARAMVTRLGVDGLRADDDFGEMVFPPAAGIPREWSELSLPMFASTTVPTAPWAEAAAQSLAAESVTIADLHIPGLRRPAFGEALRPLVARAGGFRMSEPEPDDLGRPRRLKRTIAFELPRGSYATVVLRALGQ